MRLLLLTLTTTLILGCGLSPGDAAMCDVASRLVVGEALVRRAATSAQDGDAAEAELVARQARTFAEDAKARLQKIVEVDTSQGSTWDALMAAYLDVANGANALIPETAGGSEPEAELAAVDARLKTARTALPASCFAAP